MADQIYEGPPWARPAGFAFMAVLGLFILLRLQSAAEGHGGDVVTHVAGAGSCSR